MALFGFRAYPTPMMKPLWPFFTASAIVFFGINKLQSIAVASEENLKDPRNPYGQKVLKEAAHH